ncbi:MAG: acylphosphatase [Proteobacteria bacterium]|nr:acylphosphatase [Desulfobacteraceae bacterium]MBU3980241.1 acylphosphatase [Pseudomonadota bacterium]MBU4014546.1 acylphosphatase [Pseudomonadota bacterium]MBU4068374.1 acylphosphatase [Pseudomonadota bacterium]MBU4101158.1 acylphosphatase [Pseudomonadota bacterium]
MSKKVRAHAIIIGRVQGVFFRMETKRAADSYKVLGWVKNRRDGTVEAVFEGNEENVNSILEWCKKGPRLADVKKVDVELEDYTGDYYEFELRY